MEKQNKSSMELSQKKNKQLIRIMDGVSIRAVEGDGNERKAILSFSSEAPYERWFGSEVLDHTPGAVDLKRINEIGCVLFNHKRDSVVGKVIRTWIEDSRGNAEVEFDQDEESEKIYQKVKNKTLKGVSVGYRVTVWEEVMPGQTSADGRFQGPVSIAKKWIPFEISIVSVPADPTVGVERELEFEEEEPAPVQAVTRSLDIYEKQLQINQNKAGGMFE